MFFVFYRQKNREDSQTMLKKQALLVLEDGSIFRGISTGANGKVVGEVVFNTAMTGYQEIITDPSYSKQLVTLTYPHIGNTGITPKDSESNTAQAAGLIIRDISMTASNWRQRQSLPDYLVQENIVAIADIDTRRLTRILREKGALSGCIMAGNDLNENEGLAAAKNFPGLSGMDLAKTVTTPESYQWSEQTWCIETDNHATLTQHKHHIVAYDFGVKRNILRMLADRGCRVTVVPATTSAEEVIGLNPEGIFLSNGPGDPEPCDYAITAIQSLLKTGIPVFGICLGHQLLALASGAKTVKMKFGHHGANHPVQDLSTQKVMITSQNHGFSVDESSLPPQLKATHRSLFDNSLQGIERTDTSAFGFQGHPEASPGPQDVAPLFDRFISMIRTRNQ